MPYYETVFFALMCLQEEFKGFIATYLCFLMVIGDKYISPFLQTAFDLNLYEAVFAVDFVFFCASFFIIFSRIGWILMFTMFLSLCLNIIPMLITTEAMYVLFTKYYHYFNLILFEVLFYGCLTTSVIYPWLKRNLVSLHNCIDTWSKEKWGS